LRKTESAAAGRPLAVVAFLLGAVLIFAGLGRLPLMLPDEGRNAEVAREMKESGRWLIPTYNGLPYLDKPALYFKTVAWSFALLGETEAAARLSSALSGFVLLALTFLFARREYGTRTAALAVMVIATCPLFLAFSRLVIFDMMLASFMCGAIFAGYRGRYTLGAVASALATLVKGPVGFIVPVLVLGSYLALERRGRELKRMFAPRNVAIFFGLTLPWFFGVCHFYRDFAYYGLVEESLRRYTTTEFHRTGPFWYYAPWLAIGMMTWVLVLPESILAAWRGRQRWTSADRLLIVWCVVVVLFFSVSKSKRPDYILSVVVALGVLVARVLALQPAALLRRATVALAVVCGAGAMVVARQPILRAVPALPYVLGAGAVAAAVACWRKSDPGSVAVFVCVPVAVIAAGFGGVQSYAATKSARALADRLPALPAKTELACLRCFPTGLPFYRKQLVKVFTDNGAELTSNYIVFMLNKTHPWPAGVIPLAERDRWLAARRRPVFLLARHEAVEDLQQIADANGVAVTNLLHGWRGALLPAPEAP
jgi:4-amino-4-deoxy-L-arabinose transferase-like glycosyltransferase